MIHSVLNKWRRCINVRRNSFITTRDRQGNLREEGTTHDVEQHSALYKFFDSETFDENEARPTQIQSTKPILKSGNGKAKLKAISHLNRKGVSGRPNKTGQGTVGRPKK